MPLVSRTFDQLIDFSRTSAATYVDATGKIVTTPASRNLLTYTQEFDNAAWTKSNASVTANAATAPDGTATADKLIDSTSNTTHYVAPFTGLALPSGVYVFSAYLKQAELTAAGLWFNSVAQGVAYFDLAGGTVSVTAGSILDSATITAVGSGWYRCTVTTKSLGAITYFPVISTGNPATYTGTGTSGIFIWGAQFETGSTASTYTRNVAGTFPPRFDYDPVTLAPKGFLIEEQRTNLCTYSQEFGSWASGGATVTANTLLAPDGATTADTIARTTSTSDHVYNTLSFTGDAVKVISVWIKKGTSPAGLIALLDVTASVYRLLVDITWSGTTPSLAFINGSLINSTNYGNGWWRLELATTSVTAANTNRLYIYPGRTGSVDGDTIYCWGAQAENASFATSYIPTVASQVTRTRDEAAIVAPNFAPWYNQAEGTLLVEGSTFALGAAGVSRGFAGLSNGTTAESSAIYNLGSSTLIKAEMIDDSVSQAAFTATIASQPFKVAYAYAPNNSNLALNGTAQTTDTACTVPTVNRLILGSVWAAGDYPTNGHIRSIRYYPTRLTNAQLQALTA